MAFRKTSLDAFAETIEDPVLKAEFDKCVGTIEFFESQALGALICVGGALERAFTGSECAELAKRFSEESFTNFLPAEILTHKN